MTTWAYYRVSTDKQDFESQKIGVVDYVKRNGLTIDREVIDDGVSGTVLAKDRKLNIILKKSVKGDFVITSELSRLGRSTSDVINTCQAFIKKGVNVYLVKQGMAIDNTPMGKMMIAILGAFAEMERDLISQRTKEGLAKAKAQGKKLGRQFGFTWSKLENYKEEVRELCKTHNLTDIAKKYNTSWQTVFRFVNNNNIEYKKIYRPKIRNINRNHCLTCNKRNCEGCPFYKYGGENVV